MTTEVRLPSWDDYAGDAAVAGPFENQILYRMCRDHPAHDDPYVTAGKIMAIGRIYAASPERGAGTAQRPGESLPEAIGMALSRTDLDARLGELRFEARLSRELIAPLSALHCELVSWIIDATKLWSLKSVQDSGWPAAQHGSFASKYLHFHRPNAFPISDQYARAGLQCLNGVGTTTYARLCAGVLNVAAQSPANWTPRSIDTGLVAAGRVHSARRRGPCPQCGQQKRQRALV
jgi:hypothetical protein